MSRTIRLVTGVCALVLLLCVWVYHIHDVRRLEALLQYEADALNSVHNTSGSAEANTAVTVTAGRALPIVGNAWGKISIYTRVTSADDNSFYQGIEYFYAYEDGAWRLTDSAGCAGEECQVSAHKAFQRVGSGLFSEQ